MANLFIIHGYNGIRGLLRDYIRPTAEGLGFNVFMPQFTVEEEVGYENWSAEMDKYRDKITADTVIIAHSLGTVFIPRYLAQNNLPIKLFISLAGGLELGAEYDNITTAVASFTDVTDDEIAKAIKLMTNRYSIYSDNDHLFSLRTLENYADLFHSSRVFIPGIGHMGKISGTKEVPQIFDIIKEYYNV